MSGVIRSGAGSNRAFGGMSEQQVRQEVREGLEAKTRFEKINHLNSRIAQNGEKIAESDKKIADMNNARETVAATGGRRADARAKLAAQKALLEK